MVFRRVLITGASSGVGRALALALAAPGVTLFLGGRDAARLEETVRECQSRGGQALPHALSVTDAAAMQDWIGGAGPLDLVIANAGISGGTSETMESEAQTRAIFATNLDGMLNTVLPAMAVMAAQPVGESGLRGQIAVVASVAAFLPGPSAPAYCASKAAADYWVVGAAPSARAQRIALTSLCPGFITSPMTATNDFPMPGIMSAERAAGLMLRGIRAKRTRVIFPLWVGTAARLVALLPVSWREAAARRLPAKKALLA
ncbi:SDR family NAD(P)-dependent oxidoreductase [Acidisoma cellulosilytica]|uniref:SDR family NAD(P)-dependent oxidoreductase n=1 Tax=Acidisoma cellulosilyticum TaxID=2802395 RepID=A0A964E2R8_9PROT|nr:SDR family NAD(P)-dependent oxidoreductase [Acidisoma cellulosilyticum]MCB8879078.1 SDR family NAD(P)-dependent oxidoreductase [Acidisoma cellulosilyticum]